MTLVKLNRRPFETNFNSLLDDFFADVPALFKSNGNSGQWPGFAPANIKETEKSYSIELVVPGFEKSDFKINLEQNLLTIAAEAKKETGTENEKQIRKEFQLRSFERSFTLDEKIDASAIEAKYVNGVLTLNLPKKEEVKPASKQISIQ